MPCRSPAAPPALAARPAEHHCRLPPAWGQQLEIWTTPWGFLKGAAANNATVQARDHRRQALSGGHAGMRRSSRPAARPTAWSATSTPTSLVEKVQTWVEHAVFGDMLVETDYSFYRDNNGLKYPTEIVQKRAGWPVFDLQVLGAFANPAKLAQLMTAPAPAGGPRRRRLPAVRLLGGAPAAAAALPRSSPMACTASRAPTTRWPWSSPTTWCCSSPVRRTKRARWPASPRRSGCSRTSRSATA